jgi:hypothetical protein
MRAEDENRLRQLFSGLKRHDSERMPSFQRLASVEPRESKPDFAWLRLRIAMGATALVAAVLFVISHVFRTPHAVDPEQWAALSNWSAPTDGWLAASSQIWSGNITTTTDSLIEDSSISSPQQTNTKHTL